MVHWMLLLLKKLPSLNFGCSVEIVVGLAAEVDAVGT